MSDGSDQGCTGALIDPYAKNGLCGEDGTGMADYCTLQIINMLASPWMKGWPVQIHTNGDQAIVNALDAFAVAPSRASSTA